VILPGGFSYGDYLRTGAIARFAPIMDEVRAFAERGGPVVGICNGFQILCEAGLLPGALIRNRQLRFVCRWVEVRVETSLSPLTGGLVPGEVLRVPVKHGEGQFVASADRLARLEDEGLVVFRYCAPDGSLEDDRNPNGAAHAIPSTPWTRTSVPRAASRCSTRSCPSPSHGCSGCPTIRSTGRSG
jgi:phosphoribosylformylglycinamidine synthase